MNFKVCKSIHLICNVNLPSAEFNFLKGFYKSFIVMCTVKQVHFEVSLSPNSKRTLSVHVCLGFHSGFSHCDPTVGVGMRVKGVCV